jgi:(R)-2-hydroxyacyl-CoA dehydratese activating ATPase
MVQYFLGVDIGSLAVKVVLLDDRQQVVGTEVGPSGYGGQDAAVALTVDVLRAAAVSRQDIAYTVVTGYGRIRFTEADEEISEVSCHARGAFFHVPEARTVIDVGGQDSKAIRLDSRGRVIDFAMNDKCAAGTGRGVG